jgi:UDP-N-acetylglucosamine--N-acetylmuramyl-(pentapeptide) pyrophosphoryl-undecaprenol N-acetylglucosamine transferase
VPAAVGELPAELRPEVLHQTGSRGLDDTVNAYRSRGIEADVRPFIDDMAGAYGWADLAVCRSGALTIAELAAAGVPAILVPFPAAVDDHQTRNAQFVVTRGAAVLLPENELTPLSLAAALRRMFEAGRPQLMRMAQAARDTAITDADQRLADACVAAAGGAA